MENPLHIAGGTSPGFVPSAQQSDIFTTLRDERINISIEAVAGSGKTTTLEHALRYIPHNPDALLRPRTLMLAFNKRIAETLQKRVGNVAVCKTFHSLGFGALRTLEGYRKVITDTKKSAKALFKRVERDYEDSAEVLRLVGLLKQQPYVQPDDALVDETIEFFNLTFQDVKRAKSLARHILQDAAHDTTCIDFNDMLWLPVIHNASFVSYDYVFVDEAQDTNSLQREILCRLSTSRLPTRYVFVGDPFQAIYGFRGALHDAMDGLKRDFGATSFPLSVSYRCPKAVVNEVHKRLTNRFPIIRDGIPIQSHENAQSGLVQSLSSYDKDTFPHGSIILCRNNAPLVAHCYALLKRGVRAQILGRDIGASLIALVHRMKTNDLQELQTRLAAQRSADLEVAEQRGKSLDVIVDTYDCLDMFLDMCEFDETVDDLVRKIKSIFTDSTDGPDTPSVLLSTIHKAKGGEWRDVFILDVDRIPSEYATEYWQLVQERNLLYVAITRSQQNLTYITSASWKTTPTTPQKH